MARARDCATSGTLVVSDRNTGGHVYACLESCWRRTVSWGVRSAEELRMGWVNEARKELAAGRQVQVRPFGGSMRGRIESGQLVTLAPAAPSDVRVDDVVLVEWKGNFLLHLVKEVQEDQLLIGNNLGKVNGWVSASAVVGKVIAVEDFAETEPRPATDPGGR